MRTLMIAVALVLVGSAGAYAQFNDNFDSYADQAAFNAVWATSGTAMTLLVNNITPPPQSAPNMIYQALVAQQSRRSIGAEIPAKNIDFQFEFYDEQGTGALARTYGMVYAYSGNWNEGLQQIYAIGKYNGVATTKYNARIAYNSPTVNWFTLDSGPDRSVGWHTARIKGDGVDKIEFYIDGILGASHTVSSPEVTFDWVVMGSNLTSTHGMAYDNVSVASSAVATSPSISDANSVKTHNATDFSIDLWEAGANTGNTEDRQGGPTSVVVKFDKNIQQVTNTNADVLMVNGSVGALAVAGDTLTVTVSGAVNGVVSLMTFPGIATSGSPLLINTQTLCIRPLAGDSDNGGAVNIFDLIQIRNNLNQPVAAANFRSDVTADGNINIFDLIATRNALNVTVPACP